MAGQGTAALELLELVPRLDALIAPIGGGGLLAGCATIAKALNPEIRIFGAEPELANDTFLSLAGGAPRGSPDAGHHRRRASVAATRSAHFPVLQRYVEQVLLVSDDEIRAAVKFLLMRMKLLVEPSGVMAAAAVLYRKLPLGIRSIGVILSGGNLDFEQLAAY